MTDATRVLLVAVILAGAGLGAFVWRLSRIDPAEPARLIGELRLSQWMATVLATIGGAWLALAAVNDGHALATVDLTVSVAAIVVAGWLLLWDTRQGLLILCGIFLVHAIIDTAHRPGWLAVDLAPRWFALGCAALNVYLSALCYWIQRR